MKRKLNLNLSTVRTLTTSEGDAAKGGFGPTATNQTQGCSVSACALQCC